MATDEGYWVDRAQTAEAQLQTLRDQVDRIKEDARHVMETLGARKKADGSFDIDFEKFVGNLGVEGALEVRAIIDEQYGISGAPGEKPRMKVKAG